jgi:hypothetical protein
MILDSILAFLELVIYFAFLSTGSTTKPEELYHIIEHFAQGQRRIELFGEDHNIRAGWVTVGKGLTSSNFNPQVHPMTLPSSMLCVSQLTLSNLN